MAKPFEEHKWQIEINGSFVRLRCLDECRGPWHEETCEREIFFNEHYSNRRREVKEEIKLDVGQKLIYLGAEPTEGIPDCTCETPPETESCICHFASDIVEDIALTLDVNGTYHYSYDAYHGEADAWIDIDKVALSV